MASYRHSEQGELDFHAELRRTGGTLELRHGLERFTLGLSGREREGRIYFRPDSLSFGPEEVALNEQPLEENLPQVFRLLERLKQSHITALVLEAQSFVQMAQKELHRHPTSKASFTLIPQVMAAGCFFFECVVGCGVATFLYIANIVGIASCAIPTPACVLNILAHPAAALELAFECFDCVECVRG
ncbi:hypothetical protein HRbin10_01680 [bacterium HR10]|nr:hypothetical protein HRbin10_01680 [bacterium HR10]